MQLFPDLTPLADQARGYLYDWTIQGNELRLSTAVANVGDGAMEIRGGAVTPDDKQEVYQRIYESDGSFTDQLAGTFIYHEEHSHIHFEDFAQFNLKTVTNDGGVGGVVASGDKISFCLLDVTRINGSEPRTYRSCGQNQGISAGWTDVYSRGLPGQSINIAGVADGDYWLEVVADPFNRIQESDETNNVTRIRITIDRDGDGNQTPGDTFEANNTFEDAQLLAPPETHEYENLSIHQAYDKDYFLVTAAADGILKFHIDYEQDLGALKFNVYDINKNLLGRSASPREDHLHYQLDAQAGEQFYVRIRGVGDATHPNFTFTVEQPNDPHGPGTPVINDDTGTSHEDGIATGNLLDNDWDPDNDVLTVTKVEGKDTAVGSWILLDSGARIKVNSDGSYIYDPYGKFEYLDTGEVRIDTFHYSASDGTSTVEASVNIKVDGITDTTEPNLIVGTKNSERIDGTSEADIIRARGGDDRVKGFDGHDDIRGGRGKDHVSGGEGNDYIKGGRGQDRVVGNKGNDKLNGGKGSDSLKGGDGNDSFIFKVGYGRDVIEDFNPTEDSIVIHGISNFQELLNFGTNSNGDALFSFDDGSQLRINNTTVQNLSSDDFVFA